MPRRVVGPDGKNESSLLGADVFKMDFFTVCLLFNDLDDWGSCGCVHRVYVCVVYVLRMCVHHVCCIYVCMCAPLRCWKASNIAL